MFGKEFIDLYVQNGFSKECAKAETAFVFDILFDYTEKDYILGKSLPKDLYEKAKSIISMRIKTGKPIQQLTGISFFMSKKFFVDETTLIPRPETELVVNETLSILDNKAGKILDIGCGSGCIAISVLINNIFALASAVDISEGAIKIAKKNAELFNVNNRINFIHSDLFENVNEKYDIIVSNPPYIPINVKESLQSEVKNFEPKNALFANDKEGIEYYEKIIKKAPSYLTKKSAIVFELGINQYGAVKKLLIDSGFGDIKIIKDLSGIERVISARFNF